MRRIIYERIGNKSDSAPVGLLLIRLSLRIRTDTTLENPRMNSAAISKAMHRPDDFVIEMTYLDSNGFFTRRTVSPVKYTGPRQMMALCLCREEVRAFELGQCMDVELIESHEVLMPVEIEDLGSLF